MVISSVVMRAVLLGRKGGFVVSLALIVGVANLGAQPDSVWVRGYPGTQLYGGDVVGDAAGNVYVAGRSFDNNGDYLVIKYNASGQLQWARTYDGPSSFVDQPTAITVDNLGNVIVTGYDYSFTTGSDFCTIKYNPNGDSLWIRRHNGYPPSSAADVATALVTDDSGNVYVTGYGPGPSSAADVFTIKYSPAGDSLWGQYYNFPATNGGDHGWAITLDNDGNVIVVGDSWGGTQIPPATNYDYLILKYSINGTPLYVRRQMASPATGSDVAKAVAVDTSGNIFVTGFAQEGTAGYIATFRFNPSTDSIWQQNFTANGLQGRRIALDGFGNLYVVGDTYDPHWLTLKYSTSGTFLWSRVYSNGGYSADMAVDASGDVYVAGNAYGTFGSAYGVIKYSAPGDSQWVRIHDLVGEDIAAAMHLFGANDFVVTGSATGQGQIVTVRYSTSVSVPRVDRTQPRLFSLSQNYPNPFNPSTIIRYSLPAARYVTLKVFDLLGQEVATLVDDEQPAGEHSVQWIPVGKAGGVYFYRITAGEFRAARKLLLLN